MTATTESAEADIARFLARPSDIPDMATGSPPAGLGPDHDAVDDLADPGVVGRRHHAETA